jgi:hypothetical protein
VDIGGRFFWLMVGCYGLLWVGNSDLGNLGLPRDRYRGYGRLWFTLEANSEPRTHGSRSYEGTSIAVQWLWIRAISIPFLGAHGREPEPKERSLLLELRRNTFCGEMIWKGNFCTVFGGHEGGTSNLRKLGGIGLAGLLSWM